MHDHISDAIARQQVKALVERAGAERAARAARPTVRPSRTGARVNEREPGRLATLALALRPRTTR